MGMFYNSQLKLLSVASFGFSELSEHRLSNGCGDSTVCGCSKAKPKTVEANEVQTTKAEFRIYSKFIGKQRSRVQLGDFWEMESVIDINCCLNRHFRKT